MRHYNKAFSPLLIINFLAVSSVFCVFSGPLIIPVFVAICAYIIAFPRWYNIKGIAYNARRMIRNPIFQTLVLFMLWAALTCFWSINPERSALTVARFLFLNLLGFYSFKMLSACRFDHKFFNKKLIFWMLIIANSMIIIEHVTDHSASLFFRNFLNFSTRLRLPTDKASTLLTILLPAIYVYYRDKSFVYKLLLLVAFVNYLIHPMLASTLAALVACIMIWLASKFGKVMLKLYFFSAILGLIHTPLILFLTFKSGVIDNLRPYLHQNNIERIDMWHKAMNLILQKPMIGWGLNAGNAFNHIPHMHDNIVLQLHPHNAFVQIWLETGLIGAAIISFMIYFIYQKLSRLINNKVQLEIYLGSIAAYSVYAMVSFGIWQTWFTASLWIMVFVNYILTLDYHLKVKKAGWIYHHKNTL